MINGLDNEYEFVSRFKAKKIYELDPLLRIVVDDLFPGVSEDSYIKYWKNHYKQKSDIFIRINGSGDKRVL